MTPEVAASILSETTLSLPQAAKRLPSYRGNRPVSVSCLMRWILQGTRTATGRTYLEAARIAGHWITSVEALARFVARQTPDLTGQPQPPRTISAQQRASERADAQLERDGW